MKRTIEFPLEGEPDAFVAVEVDDDTPSGLQRAGRPREAVERAGQSFESAVARIKPAVSAIVEDLNEWARKPDELVIEFGIKFDAKAGIVISSVGVESTLTVTLKWAKGAE